MEVGGFEQKFGKIRAESEPQDAPSVFVSYSHEDATLVTPVVRLLRGTNDVVFQDADSIKPGARWRSAIEAALNRATLVVIFWCAHSAKSREVQREYSDALAAAKNLLPVLLDRTPLPEQLSAFQYVDFSQVVAGSHRYADSSPEDAGAPASMPPRGRVGCLPSLIGLAILVWAVAGYFLTYSGSPEPAPAPPGPNWWVIGLVAALVILGVVVVGVFWKTVAAVVRRRAENRIVKDLAAQLSREITSRLTGSPSTTT